MKLQLTIQEMQDAETKATYKGVFGTLELTLPNKEGKPKKERINFATNTKEIQGFDRIVEGLVTSAMKLRKQNLDDPEVVNGDITIPNRAKRRSK